MNCQLVYLSLGDFMHVMAPIYCNPGHRNQCLAGMMAVSVFWNNLHTDFSDQFRSVSTHHSRTAYGHRIWRQLATIFYFSFFWLVLLFPTTLWFLLMLWRWLVNTHMWRRIEISSFHAGPFDATHHALGTIACSFSFAKGFTCPICKRGKKGGKSGNFRLLL